MGKVTAFYLAMILALPVFGQAPELSSFKREQLVNRPNSPNPLIRIWSIYVGQGDSYLIQIPKELCDCSETYDVLVDAGTAESYYRQATLNFLQDLYPEGATIEKIVISHHDQDHVAGFSPLLRSTKFKFEVIYHNGLASYLPDVFDIDLKQGDDDKIYSPKDPDEEISRFMSIIEDNGTLSETYTINSLEELIQRHNANQFHNVYERLAESISVASNNNPNLKFSRAHIGSQFIEQDFKDLVSFDLLWPEKNLMPYNKKWGKTINGNSVVFNFHYKDFSMLFTGDLNKASTKRIEDTQKAIFNTRWTADILKAPHHGSRHVQRSFYKRQINPFVLAVGSNGDKGFKKHKHPNPEAISWMGGAHRFYNTNIQEKRFKLKGLTYQERARLLDEKMTEHAHILIETDGDWFRIVEVPAIYQDILLNVQSVKQIRRSNGTRWVKATPEVQ